MLKSITLTEWLIIVVIIGILAAMFLGKASQFSVADRCLSKGYVMASGADGRTSRYCTKVQGGNTIVIHVDSLR